MIRIDSSGKVAEKVIAQIDMAEPDVIYHYCSVGTFISIIENKTLRLSDITKSNDSMELIWFVESIQEEFDRYYDNNMDFLSIFCDKKEWNNVVRYYILERYPLLAETLRTTLIYYYLRMKVEKTLVEKFKIDIKSQDITSLNQIIQKAFSCNADSPEYEKKITYKVFFTSRKTLLNEFNYFEGNMNIFQPAIDINPKALNREVNAIELKLKELLEDSFSVT